MGSCSLRMDEVKHSVAFDRAMLCAFQCAYNSGYKRRKTSWRDDDFLQDSYTKWSCKEIIKQLKSNPDRPPLQTLEDFLTKMDKYSAELSRSDQSSYMFSVAYDTTQWIIDMLIK